MTLQDDEPQYYSADDVDNLIAMGTKTTYTCSFCNNTYPTHERLKYHIKCKHGAPSYSCHLCGESFKWQNSLQRHRHKYHSSALIEDVSYTAGVMYDGSGTAFTGTSSSLVVAPMSSSHIDGPHVVEQKRGCQQ